MESFPVGSVNHLQIPLRDKWRLPLILVRVSKSLPLQESDSKIWACFVHNKTQEELIESIAATLAERVPMESREVLKYTAHALLLPDNCPFPISRSGSGTASPVTLSRKSSRCSSRSSSRAPSRDSSPGPSGVAAAAAISAWESPSIAATGTGTAVVGRMSSCSGESVSTTTPPRSSTKLGLPPLTPSSHKIFRTRSDGSAYSSPYKQCNMSSAVNMTSTTATGAGNTVSDTSITTPPKAVKTSSAGELEPLPMRKVNSFSNLWPVRMTRSAFASLSAPSSPHASPQASPRKIVPTTEEEVTWTVDEEVFAELDRLPANDSGERVSIKPSVRQRMRQRNSLGGGIGRDIEVKPRGAPRGGVDRQGGGERGGAERGGEYKQEGVERGGADIQGVDRQGGAPRGGADKQGGVVVNRRALPHNWGDGPGLSQWAAGLLQRQVRRGSRTSGTVTPMKLPISPLRSDDDGGNA